MSPPEERDMPRQPRYFIPGIPQHVILRGVDRQATFFAADDYTLFLTALGKNAAKYDCSIHAHVLMTNHVHLLMTPAERRAIPNLIQAMGRNYVQAINRRYGRTGTLWQGRYKASLIQEDVYFLTCQRYIELNPVRAGMVSDPGDYPHSSYRHHAFGRPAPAIHPHDVYLALANTPDSRRSAYRRLFDVELSRPVVDRIRETTNSCRVLGNDRFIDQIESMLGRRVRPRPRGRPKRSASEAGLD